MKTLVFFVVLLGATYASKLPFQAFAKGGDIAGGQDAQHGEFPFMVSVRYNLTWFDYGHICGGTILTETHILTAAHCFKDAEWLSNFYIWAGVTNLRTKENQQIVKGRSYSLHPQYNEWGSVSAYDIGILYLERPLQMNQYVVAVTLPPALNDPVSGNVLAVGWGRINSSRTSSDQLQKVSKTVQPLLDCKQNLEDIVQKEQTALDTRENGSNFCTAGGPTEQDPKATCPGDSGGPLLQEQGNGKWIQVGIVSWGIQPCPWPNAPSVHTKVSHLLDWIERRIKN